MALGSITIDLLMKTGAFETDTKRASKAMKQLEKDIDAAAKAIGAAITAAAGTMVYLINKQLEAADAASKLAQSAGVSIETLTSLGYAADLSGVNTETLGKSLGKLAKNMADTNMGIGDAIDAFAALGISVKDADGNMKSTDKVLLEVANKFSGFADGTNKTALAMELFGKQGMELIPLLNAGADGLAEMQKEAQQLGIVFDTETGKAAEEFNDTLDKIKKSGDGLVNQVMVAMLPSMQQLATAFFNFSKNAENTKTIVESIVSSFKILMTAVNGVVFAYGNLGRMIAAVAASATMLAKGEGKAALKVWKDWREDLSKSVDTLIEIQNIIDKIGIAKPPSATVSALPPPSTLPSIAKSQAPSMISKADRDKAAKELEDWNKRLRDADAAGWSAYIDKLNDLWESEAMAEAQWHEVANKKILDDKELMMKQYYEFKKNQAEDEMELERTVAEYGIEASKKATEAAKELGMTFSSAFEDAIVEGKKFSDVLRGLAQDLLRIATRRLVTEPLANAFSSALSGMFGGANADGGDVIGGRSYLVGENGPEMFTPRTTGSITPNGAMGNTVVQNINITTGIQQTVRAEILSLMPQIAGAAKAAVADAKLRGGSFAMAMR